MKITLLVLAAMTASCCLSDVPAGKPSFKERRLRTTGGQIAAPDSMKGKIVIVNGQAKFTDKDVSKTVDALRKLTKFNIAVVKDEAGAKDANVTIRIVEKSGDPTVLVAPEDRWAVFNVSKMGEGLEDNVLKDRLFNARCRKELIRVFFFVTGGVASQYPGNLTVAASIPELDEVSEDIPVDMADRAEKYLAKHGVTPLKMVNYSTACQEGWAPQPTNEYQKAVWEKIHAIPTKPMKIEFDPKKGR